MKSGQIQIFHHAQIVGDASFEIIVLESQVLALSFAFFAPFRAHIPHETTNLSR